MKMINVYGGPCTGKSTTTAGLFYKLKVLGYAAEIVTEYAKELTYSGQYETLLDQQEFIFAEQNRRQHILRPHVEYAITDSPLPLSAVYASQEYPIRAQFCDFVFSTFDMYDNVNIVLNRTTEYTTSGRNHDLDQAIALDETISSVLKERNIPFHAVDVKEDTIDNILRLLEIPVT